MSVLSHLKNRATDATLSTVENDSINTSINTISSRLNYHFGTGLSTHFRFGSSTRGTILPRRLDQNSDIDYMVVFSEGGYQPQTYLSRLKSFAETYYSSSTIKQSSPSIVLELNHIKFDLVPALTAIFGEYKIPDLSLGWQDTSPREFNSELTDANQRSGNNLKPAIRLAKVWNASRSYVFESYSLERHCAQQSFWFASNLRDYFYGIIESLPSYVSTQWRQTEISRAKRIVSETKQLETDGYPYLAEEKIKELIP